MKSTLLSRLKQQATDMTPGQRRVADYILKNPVDASFMTLEQISGNVGTSTATVMRLAIRLGYTGYSDFQRDLQEVLRDRVAPTTRLEINKKKLAEHSSILADCAENQVGNLKATMDFITQETTDRCLELMLGATRIYIVGMRSSFAIAYYLHQALNQIMGNCKLLKADSGDNVDDIINLGQTDLVIAITMPRYSLPTVEMVRAIKGFGPKIVAITDGYSSPLAPLADVVLPCSVRSLAFHNSIAGPILLVDFLITSIAMKEPLRTKSRLEAAEPVIQHLNILVDV